ncbi:hypothetical protein N7520_004924 [Penicillium odoratum]|uniref:uncharacterized protein n=1 Tax=Penicillium odoratum TaxID=1167516 RepID=UPI0025493A6D|nr:uncharacterized protein N7520_004924 [Penicillium odoratum]KAJ5765365.1 hypothetical protein N7520_004924 [Penicillium odoratum]
MLSIIMAVLASATIVSAQYTPTIEPSSVPLVQREGWCNSQIQSCPLLCLQMANTTGALTNDCSPKTLDYQCICSNGISPNSSEYSLTMPYFICTEANNQCVTKCTDSTCQGACRSDHPCGAQHPVRVNVTNATATPSAKVAVTTTSSVALGTSTATGMASRMLAGDMGYLYGLCGLVGGFVVGFSALL